MSTTVRQLPASANIECYAGDNFTTTITFQVDNGSGSYTPADFTGASARMQIKRRRGDASALLTLASPSSGLSFPTTSSIKIEITSAQTADLAGLDLLYDLQITDSLGDVRTYLSGFFITKQQVTT